MSNALYDTYRNRCLRGLSLSVIGATNATPIEIQLESPHFRATNDYINIHAVGGNTAANGDWLLTSTAADKFTLQGSVGNGAYTAGTGFAHDHIDILTDVIKAVLVDIRGGHYVVDLVNDQVLSVISAVDRKDAAAGFTTTSPALATKTASAGIFGAAFTTLPLVAADTRPLGAIVLYKDTGAVGTSPLIAYIDTATGLPVTPNGGDITIAWQASNPKIYKL